MAQCILANYDAFWEKLMHWRIRPIFSRIENMLRLAHFVRSAAIIIYYLGESDVCGLSVFDTIFMLSFNDAIFVLMLLCYHPSSVI